MPVEEGPAGSFEPSEFANVAADAGIGPTRHQVVWPIRYRVERTPSGHKRIVHAHDGKLAHIGKAQVFVREQDFEALREGRDRQVAAIQYERDLAVIALYRERQAAITALCTTLRRVAAAPVGRLAR